MEHHLIIVCFIIFVALVFDFLNGFHDAANSIATVVSTHVLSPRAAVLMAAFWNFAAAILLETKVAATISNIVKPEYLDPYLVMFGLLGAIAWNILTWYWGLPASSSHALVGGLAGAALVHAGLKTLVMSELMKIVPFIVIAPVVGLVLGRLMMILMQAIFRNSSPRSVDYLFRRGQLVSASIFSFSHGMNDAQKTMGIIMALLISVGLVPSAATGGIHVPLWVILSCHAAIGLGTYFGGWRIVRTLGMRLTKLQPVGGFCAETGGGVTIVLLSLWKGIPLSTTHTITGAIVGAGSTRRLSAVRWGIARNIIWAWVLTIPCAGLVGAVLELIFRPFLGS